MSQNLLSVIHKHSNKDQLDKLSNLFRTIIEEVDDKILTQAEKRPLAPSEVAFLKYMRPAKKRQLTASNDEIPPALSLSYDDNDKTASLSKRMNSLSLD